MFKTVELKTENYAAEYLFIEEEMKYKTEELIKEHFDTTYELSRIELMYSLWYSQWDGVSFRKWDFYLEDIIKRQKINLTFDWVDLSNYKFTEDFNLVFTIITNSYANHYFHNKTFTVDYSFDEDCLVDEIVAKEWVSEEIAQKIVDKVHEEMESIADMFDEILKDISLELEKYWYFLEEEEDKQAISSQAFEDWKILNNIQVDEWLDYYDYTNKETKNYIKIAERWDTYLDWLWVDFPIHKLIEQKEIKETKFYIFK